MNTKKRAGVALNTAVTLVITVDGVSSSHLVSVSKKKKKNRSEPHQNLIKPFLGLSADREHGWEGSDIYRRFYTARRYLTLSPCKLLKKKSVFMRAERA